MAKERPHALPSVAAFLAEYGIDHTNTARGGLAANLKQEMEAEAEAEAEAAGGMGGGAAGAAGGGGSERQIYLLQRKTGKHGAGLGRTTGWIHRLDLKKLGVTMLGGVSYDKVDDAGLHISLKGNPKKGEPPSSRVLDVDTVVVCAGQVSQRELEKPLQAPGVPGSPSRKP